VTICKTSSEAVNVTRLAEEVGIPFIISSSLLRSKPSSGRVFLGPSIRAMTDL
jgi:hypothetical protein